MVNVEAGHGKVSRIFLILVAKKLAKVIRYLRLFFFVIRYLRSSLRRFLLLLAHISLYQLVLNRSVTKRDFKGALSVVSGLVLKILTVINVT